MLRLRRQPNPHLEQRIRQKGGLVDTTRQPLEPTTTEPAQQFPTFKERHENEEDLRPHPRSGRIGFRRSRTGRKRYRRSVWPIARRYHGQPTGGAGLQCHREPRRHRCGGLHAQRGSPWPDVRAHRLRCTWSRRRPCHNGDQQDGLRRRRMLRPDPNTYAGRPQWEDLCPRQLGMSGVPLRASALSDPCAASS
jgi:hypothetical protein